MEKVYIFDNKEILCYLMCQQNRLFSGTAGAFWVVILRANGQFLRNCNSPPLPWPLLLLVLWLWLYAQIIPWLLRPYKTGIGLVLMYMHPSQTSNTSARPVEIISTNVIPYYSSLGKNTWDVGCLHFFWRHPKRQIQYQFVEDWRLLFYDTHIEYDFWDVSRLSWDLSVLKY